MEDGSEQYYVEPMVMPVKPPGKPTLFINPKDVMYERYPLPPADRSNPASNKTPAFVYAKHKPSASELDAARDCVGNTKASAS